MRKIKTLVVDDSLAFRESIEFFFQEQPEIELLGILDNGLECIKFSDKNPVDLVIMDARLSGMDGIETTKKLKDKHPNIKVITCTIWAEDEIQNSALNAGVDDHFVKGEPLPLLIKKIRALFN